LLLALASAGPIFISPRNRVAQASPPTIRRATVDEFNPASTWAHWSLDLKHNEQKLTREQRFIDNIYMYISIFATRQVNRSIMIDDDKC
jgi:hypothetical protein